MISRSRDAELRIITRHYASTRNLYDKPFRHRSRNPQTPAVRRIPRGKGKCSIIARDNDDDDNDNDAVERGANRSTIPSFIGTADRGSRWRNGLD